MLQPLCGYVLDVIGLKSRLCAVRHRLVAHQHGARAGAQLANACRSARAAGIGGRLGEPRRDEGDSRVVPSPGARAGRGRLQYRCFIRLDACATSRCLGDFAIQLAVGLRDNRGAGLGLGCRLAVALSPAGKHPALSSAEFDYIAAGQEKHLQHDGTRPAVLSLLRRRNFWASPCLAFWPTRHGER
jgi:ACS family hexuronate transporter-like MFS transporter